MPCSAWSRDTQGPGARFEEADLPASRNRIEQLMRAGPGVAEELGVTPTRPSPKNLARRRAPMAKDCSSTTARIAHRRAGRAPLTACA